MSGPAPAPVAVRLHAADSVAVLLHDAAPGATVTITGDGAGATVVATGDIPRHHKIALTDLAEGATMIRNAIAIGRASAPVAAGDWVHVHNLVSAHAAPPSRDGD